MVILEAMEDFRLLVGLRNDKEGEQCILVALMVVVLRKGVLEDDVVDDGMGGRADDRMDTFVEPADRNSPTVGLGHSEVDGRAGRNCIGVGVRVRVMAAARCLLLGGIRGLGLAASGGRGLGLAMGRVRTLCRTLDLWTLLTISKRVIHASR